MDKGSSKHQASPHATPAAREQNVTRREQISANAVASGNMTQHILFRVANAKRPSFVFIGQWQRATIIRVYKERDSREVRRRFAA